MAEITAAAVKALRDRTDLPMMRCKAALMEADGDTEKAVEILKAQVGKILDKRADNETREGRVFTKAAEDGSSVAMVEIQCESAPVAASEGFAKLGEALVAQLLHGPGASSAAELLKQPVPGGAGTLQELFDETVNKIAEKFVVGRVQKFAGPCGVYVHHDGKTAAVFQAQGAGKHPDVLRDVAMHIAAMKPTHLNADSVDPAAVAAEREKLLGEAKASGKPEAVWEKIVGGRMSIFLREQGVLLEQAFAKDEAKTVAKVVSDAGYAPHHFELWVLGS